MRIRYWITAAFLAAACQAVPTEAGLADRLARRADARAEREHAELRQVDSRPDAASFTVRSEKEIGLFVRPVNYQASAEPSLAPIPEAYPYATGTTPPPGPSFVPGRRVVEMPVSPTPVPPAYDAPAYPAGPPAYVPDGSAIPPYSPIGPDYGGVPLYPKVHYKDLDNVHPCGVPTVVQVLDPCERKDPCTTCGPRCVFVKICVPPDQTPQIKVERHGRKVKYKFDDYQVEIESEDGLVTVDYDD